MDTKFWSVEEKWECNFAQLQNMPPRHCFIKHKIAAGCSTCRLHLLRHCFRSGINGSIVSKGGNNRKRNRIIEDSQVGSFGVLIGVVRLLQELAGLLWIIFVLLGDVRAVAYARLSEYVALALGCPGIESVY
jgi:hypothetical protein